MEVETCKRELVIEIPSEVVQKESETRAVQYARTARVPGFRPGRVPRELILRRFRGAIRDEVAQTLLPRFFQDAVKEQNLAVVGDPRFEDLKIEDDQPLTCKVTFEIYPVIEVGDYKGLEVTEDHAPVTDADIGHALEELRERAATFEVVEGRPAADGDILNVRYEGRDVKSPKGALIEATEGTVRLGEKNTLAEFNQNLQGTRPGDVREFEAVYPADFPESKLAGKTIRFRAEVQAVKHKVAPPLDDELAKTVSSSTTLEDLKAELHKQIEERRNKEAEASAKHKLMDMLVERVKFPLPEALVEERLDEKLKSVAGQLLEQGVDPRRANLNWTKLRVDWRSEAEKEVRGALILEKIADAEHVEVSEEELDEAIRNLSAESGETPAELKTRLTQNERLARLQSGRRNQKALDLIYRNANVVRQPGLA
ncbi:MAG: trigger factor [Terriglobia bacterium]